MVVLGPSFNSATAVMGGDQDVVAVTVLNSWFAIAGGVSSCALFINIKKCKNVFDNSATWSNFISKLCRGQGLRLCGHGSHDHRWQIGNREGPPLRYRRMGMTRFQLLIENL